MIQGERRRAMTPGNTSMYRELMSEIWRRTEFIRAFEAAPQLGIYNVTRIECVCLQVRMILENIALACLVANGEHLESLPKRIEKESHADLILKRLDDVVADCYPQPLVLVSRELDASTAARGVPPEQYLGEWVDRPSDEWLNRVEFKEVYGRLGNILHARNPLGTSQDINYYEKMAPVWTSKIVGLVTHHKIAIRSEDRLYIAQIPPSGDVSITPFERFG